LEAPGTSQPEAVEAAELLAVLEVRADELVAAV
jgi:hypothetical protein